MKTLFSIILIFLFISCSDGSKAPVDDDSAAVLPDGDEDVMDDEEEEKIDEKPEEKPSGNENNQNTPETDSDECYPPLNKAAFPYYDKNAKITFCRPDCDTPTEDDPICISNLWEEQNEKVCHEFPHYSCCGYPCAIENLKSETKDEFAELHPTLVEYVPMHRCDRIVDPVGWSFDGSPFGNVKSWNLSGGKIAFELYPSQSMYDGVEEWWVASKYAIYDTATQKYTFIIPSRHQEQAYYKGHRLALISDKRTLELNNSNIFLAYIGDDATVEIVYDRIVKSISYEPALNENWAFVNLVEPGHKRLLYAKIGEWKWTSLGDGLGWDPGIVGNTLAVVDDNVDGWICDLTKYPKSLKECRKVNRAGESVRSIRINSENEKQFVYNSNMRKIVYLELKDDEFVYKDLITDFTDETVEHRYSLAPEQFRGNIVMYEEVTTNQYEEGGGRICYYRLDKEKRYCMNPMEDDKTYEDGATRFYALYAEFEGKWLVFQLRQGKTLMLRDMDCYCMEEGVCPFEE